MRLRTLIIIVLIVAAVTPAAIGAYARQRLERELLAAGVAPERIVTAAGWRSSRVLFPLPGQPTLEMDLQLFHGPFLGRALGWGWLGAEGELLYLQQGAATLQAQLSLSFWLRFQAVAEAGLHPLLSGWQWQNLQLEVSGHQRSQQWRGSLQAEELAFSQPEPDLERTSTGLSLSRLQLDWSWDQHIRPNLGLWLQGQNLQLNLAGASAPLSIAQLAFDSDWLEQGSSGALRQHWELRQVETLGRSLERIHGSWQAAPLDRATIHQLPQWLATASGEHAPSSATWLIQFAPLLALRPVWEIDSLGISHQGEAILLSGQVQTRPGGINIRTRGGGPESLYQHFLELAQFSQPDIQAEQVAVRASQLLQLIRRQGWLQASAGPGPRQLRADIVVNY